MARHERRNAIYTPSANYCRLRRVIHRKEWQHPTPGERAVSGASRLREDTHDQLRHTEIHRHYNDVIQLTFVGISITITITIAIAVAIVIAIVIAIAAAATTT
jgi:hypothetical protein